MSCWIGNQPLSAISAIESLSSDLERLLKEGDDLSDVTIVVADQKFKLHKIILAGRNEYFKALLFGGLRQGSISDLLKNNKSFDFQNLIKGNGFGCGDNGRHDA